MTEENKRTCGECQLCCKLLPVHGDLRRNGVDLPGNFHKPAGQRCPHQRFKKGCAVYGQPLMPRACKLWSCQWLKNPQTRDMVRPDRSGYVIDTMPDFITLTDNDTGKVRNIPVVQVWCDPARPMAWRDPNLLAFLNARGSVGVAALIRYSSSDAFTLLPPSLCSDGKWHEIHGGTHVPERTPMEIARVVGGKL